MQPNPLGNPTRYVTELATMCSSITDLVFYAAQSM